MIETQISYMGLYENSIHIEVSPEDTLRIKYDEENIPSPFNIVFCDVTDIIDLFNSPKGYKVLKLAMDGKIDLNLFPTDSVGITEYEREFLVGHESLFRKPNIHLYQTWWDKDLSFNYYLGATIHTALDSFIERFRNLHFDESTKQKHFLTLNNLHTPDREGLYKLYNSLSDTDKEKISCSFIFANIYLDKDLPETMTIYEDVYGIKGVNHYEHNLIEIVSESSGIATTEKSFKPLLAGVPFIHWISDLNGYTYPIEYLKSIGIDTVYFGIDYSDKENVKNKIKELLSMTSTEIIERYESDFEKAKQNKIKFYKFVDDITNKLILK